MNEWVGQDMNVVGPLEIPPSEEFPITDNSHFFGKFFGKIVCLEDLYITVEVLKSNGALFVYFIAHGAMVGVIYCSIS